MSWSPRCWQSGRSSACNALPDIAVGNPIRGGGDVSAALCLSRLSRSASGPGRRVARRQVTEEAEQACGAANQRDQYRNGARK